MFPGDDEVLKLSHSMYIYAIIYQLQAQYFRVCSFTKHNMTGPTLWVNTWCEIIITLTLRLETLS